jgi:hypothetical protein
MAPNLLSEDDFKATFEGKMFNVTSQPGDCIDIWAYVRRVQSSVELSQHSIDEELVESVYRSQNNKYDHVLVSQGRKNVFLVIVVDKEHRTIYGHRLLDLNAEYGLDGGF